MKLDGWKPSGASYVQLEASYALAAVAFWNCKVGKAIALREGIIDEVDILRVFLLLHYDPWKKEL